MYCADFFGCLFCLFFSFYFIAFSSPPTPSSSSSAAAAGAAAGIIQSRVIAFFATLSQWLEITIPYITDSNGVTHRSLGSMLVFPENTHPLGIPTELSVMYIRECYPNLMKVIEGKVEPSIIFGTPGIGKNFFNEMCVYIFV
jgi:hypothetical protein